MPIQLRPSTQALNVHDRGGSVPPWFGDYANKAKWYNDGQPASGPTNGFYNLVKTSDTKVQEFIQYGQNTDGWAGTRFIDETVTVNSQTENDDGSISVHATIDIGPIASYPTDHIKTPVRVHYTVKVNNVTVHDRLGSTGDSYLQMPSPSSLSIDTTVQPQTESQITTVQLDWVYPDGEFPNAHFVLGVALYNPNLPTYQPDTVILDGTAWSIINNSARGGSVYNGSSWQDVPALPNNKQNQVNPDSGYNYFDGTNWLQSPLPH